MCVQIDDHKRITNTNKARQSSKPVKAWKIVFKEDNAVYSPFTIASNFQWCEGINKSSRYSTNLTSWETHYVESGFHCFKFKKDAINFIKYLKADRYSGYNLRYLDKENVKKYIRLMEVYIEPKNIVIIAPWDCGFHRQGKYIQPITIVATQVTAKLPKN